MYTFASFGRHMEVIDMAFRDLLYKIVPQNIDVRTLRTSQDKQFDIDSKYKLTEKKKFVTQGKKTIVEYVFDIDL